MMSRIAHDFFAQSPVLAYPVVALVIFTVVFVAVTFRTMRMKSGEVDARASLPLAEDGHGQG